MPDSSAFTRLGLTFRQLDHWTKKGYLIEQGQRDKPGRGSLRTWAYTEVRIAERIKKMLDAGIVLETAAKIAREGETEVDLAPGIHLSLHW